MKNYSTRFWSRLFFLIIIGTPLTASAWGRRGHQIVGENAAILASAEPEGHFLRNHSFDLGYYANVPDFVWKREATYKFEKVQHFMDLEIYDRGLIKHPEIENPLQLSREEFDAKFPEIPEDAGRAFWRIRELDEQLAALTKELKEMTDKTGVPRQKVQAKWLVVAGTMAHYVGDLSMPLHVSENYDGVLTNQKGIHGYFEEVVVDELYPEIGSEVHRDALKLWPAFVKKNKGKTLLELLTQLAEGSRKEIPGLLAMDRKQKRENLHKNAQAYASLIRRQLVQSTLTLAEIYRRELGWSFDENKFYFFSGEPEYIKPGAKKVAPAAEGPEKAKH